MKKTINDYVLTAYKKVKPALQEELLDKTPVTLVINFRLGELRELDAMEKAKDEWREGRSTQKETIISGG